MMKSTNWQSRTAMVIMPPLFAFAAAAENKLVHSLHEKASHKEHSKQMAAWSQQHELNEHKKKLQKMTTQKILAEPGMREEGNLTLSADEENERRIVAKFRESVVNSGVRVVEGETLGVHHKIANFWQENPFKILAAIGGKSTSYLHSFMIYNDVLFRINTSHQYTMPDSPNRTVHFQRTRREAASPTSNEANAYTCFWTICSNHNASISDGVQRIYG